MKALRNICLDKANGISSETIAEINRQETEVYTTRKARLGRIKTEFFNELDRIALDINRGKFERQQKADALYVARAQMAEDSPEYTELLEQERELQREGIARKADAAQRRIDAREAMNRATEEAEAACTAGLDDCRTRMAAAREALRIARESIKNATPEELREIYRDFFGEDYPKEQQPTEQPTETQEEEAQV